MSKSMNMNMLRTRRKDNNVKPNRRLDRKSSRGMIYENEELRLKTININAEIERGQSDIKKLKRENEMLKKEIWCLRDEYEKLDSLLKNKDMEFSSSSTTCSSDTESTSSYTEESIEVETSQNIENVQKTNLKNLHTDFDLLSVVPEENSTNSERTVSITTDMLDIIKPDQSYPSNYSIPDVTGSAAKHFFSPIRLQPSSQQTTTTVTDSNQYYYGNNMAKTSADLVLKTDNSSFRACTSSTFSNGGNLEELLNDIENISQDILKLSDQNLPGSPLEDSACSKPYKSELNVVLMPAPMPLLGFEKYQRASEHLQRSLDSLGNSSQNLLAESSSNRDLSDAPEQMGILYPEDQYFLQEYRVASPYPPQPKLSNENPFLFGYESSNNSNFTSNNNSVLGSNQCMLPSNHNMLPSNHNTLPSNNNMLPSNHRNLSSSHSNLHNKHTMLPNSNLGNIPPINCTTLQSNNANSPSINSNYASNHNIPSNFPNTASNSPSINLGLNRRPSNITLTEESTPKSHYSNLSKSQLNLVDIKPSTSTQYLPLTPEIKQRHSITFEEPSSEQENEEQLRFKTSTPCKQQTDEKLEEVEKTPPEKMSIRKKVSIHFKGKKDKAAIKAKAESNKSAPPPCLVVPQCQKTPSIESRKSLTIDGTKIAQLDPNKSDNNTVTVPQSRKSISTSPERRHVQIMRDNLATTRQQSHKSHKHRNRQMSLHEKNRQRRSTISGGDLVGNGGSARERSFSVCTDRSVTGGGDGSRLLGGGGGGGNTGLPGFSSGYSLYDEYYPHDEDRERTNSVCSSIDTTTGHRNARKMSNISNFPVNGKIPWCGCWGNGCL